MLTVGTYLADRYEIVSKIGAGGMSDVYKAKDHVLGRFVAIKVLKPEFSEDRGFVAKFRTEAQSAAGLEHPNIVNIYDVGSEEGLHYIVMEYVEGITLKTYIEKKGQLSFKEAVSIAIQVARGIEAAHNKQIIHRDIKPENFVWEESSQTLVLIDIDAGRQFTPSKTRDTVFTGTYGNAAPEQFGFGQSDIRTDVYGLGKTFLSLLSGNESSPESDTDIPGLSADLATILQKATSFKPEDRYTTVLQFQKALLKLQIQRNQKKDKPRSGFGRSLTLLFAGIVLGSGIGSGIGVMVAQKSFQTASTTSVNTQQDESALPVSETDTIKFSEPDTCVSQKDDKHSLAEKAGVEAFDAYKYQDQIDTIIVAAYQNDAKSVTSNLESLISQLYEEPKLTRNPPEDYSTYDVLPKGYWILSGMDAVRLRLVYRDSILKKNIGSYKDYDAQLLHMIRHCLYGTNGSDTSNLYQYAHSTPDKRNNYYEFCLSDLLDNVQCVLDQRDNFTCPQEADSQ